MNESLTAHTIEQVDVGIVVALALESAAIRERLRSPIDLRPDGRHVSVGRLGASTVAVVTAGVGGDAAAGATRLLIAGHRPRRIVAAGLCGGLDPTATRGTVVVAERVGLSPAAVPADDGSYSGRETFPVDSPPPGDPRPDACRPLRGLLVTACEVVKTTEAKRILHEATGAIAVDMESWWVVREAARNDLPTHAVRVVCDTATETLPEDIASLASAKTPARMAGAALRALWRRPSAAIDLIELRETAYAAAESLATFLESAFGHTTIRGSDGTRPG